MWFFCCCFSTLLICDWQNLSTSVGFMRGLEIHVCIMKWSSQSKVIYVNLFWCNHLAVHACVKVSHCMMQLWIKKKKEGKPRGKETSKLQSPPKASGCITEGRKQSCFCAQAHSLYHLSVCTTILQILQCLGVQCLQRRKRWKKLTHAEHLLCRTLNSELGFLLST